MSVSPSSSGISSSTEPTLKETLAAARDRLIANTRRAYAGIETLKEYSAQIDGLIHRIFREANDTRHTPVALVALGGYGRRHQCQFSDVDLLVVFDGQIGTAEERILSEILHPIWDLGLSVGHQVRELAHFESPDTDNPEFLVALLDARFIDGDQNLFSQINQACLQPNSAWCVSAQKALLELTRQRHAQFNHTVFHLEPDLKDSPGSLRDATAIRLLRRMETDWMDHGQTDIGRIEEAEDFMLRARSILHMERGRNLNKLNHDLQETVAVMFGSPGAHPQNQVEALMSTYFHHAQLISRGLATVLKLSDKPSNVTVTPIGNDLEQSWDGIRFVDGTRASLQPHIWLRPFETALEQGVGISEQVLTCIERHGDRYTTERFFPSIKERDLLLRVLRPRPGLYARLSEMHGCGLLGRLFPEFQKVYCHVIRDFYHTYTVDEHTLLTIQNVEHLCTPRTNSRKRFSGLLDEIDEPQLLILALLFHDVGKWTDKNHSEEGARIATVALRRIRLREQSVTTIKFLIRHHLQMSNTAFRRDIEDPDTVTQFARLVGTEEHLKLLCLLTFADVDGVGPEVMTPWKEEMLWRLYVATYNRLTLKYSDDVIDNTAVTRDTLTRGRPNDISQDDLIAFLEGYPQRYLRVVDRSSVYDHVRLSRALQPTDVHTSLTETDAAWELSAITIDQPGLFANVCGVLSYFGMDIVHGQAMTNEHSVVLDIFQFIDQEHYLRLNTEAKTEIASLLGDVVAGRTDIETKLRGRQHAQEKRCQPAGPKTVVRFNNYYSKRFTVLEIVTNNAWGLLYRISRTISSQECDIDLVLISTDGARAVDVFHVTRHGGKLSDSVQKQLTDALETVLDFS